MAEMLAPNVSSSISSRWAIVRTEVFRFFLAFRKYWWIPFLTISVGLAISAWFISQWPPSYLSQGRMVVSGKINVREGADYTEDLVNFFGTNIQLMKSGDVLQRAQSRVQALHPDMPQSHVDLDVGQFPGTSLFALKAIGVSPGYTQAFLQAVMDEYIQVKRDMRSLKAEGTSIAITEQLGQIQKELAHDEDDLLSFQKENNVGFLKEQGNSAAQYLSGLNNELADLKKEEGLLKNEDLEETLSRTEKQGGQAEASGSPSISDTIVRSYGPGSDYATAKRRLAYLKSQREELLITLRPTHPEVIKLDAAISDAQSNISLYADEASAELKTRRDSLRLRIVNLEQMIETWQKKALEFSALIARWEQIQAKKDRAQAQYNTLLTSLSNIGVGTSLDQDTVTILEQASPPISVKPGLVRAILLGLGGGAFVGFVFVVALDKINDQLKSFRDVQVNFRETVLGHVPHEVVKGMTALDLIRPDDPRHMFAESFRTIRSSILYLPMAGARPKSLIVSSAVPGEGKSTVSANLAITLSFLGSKTLLVDGDLRRGKLHTAFGISGATGFAEVLMQRISWKEALQPTLYENLSLLPRGQNVSQPGEFFLGKVTDRFLQEVYREFEYVIIDSAPVIVADDTASLAPKIDAALFVVRFGTSSMRLTHRALQQLYHRQVNVLGLVLNDLSASAPDYEYYQYSKYVKEYTRAD